MTGLVCKTAFLKRALPVVPCVCGRPRTGTDVDALGGRSANSNSGRRCATEVITSKHSTIQVGLGAAQAAAAGAREPRPLRRPGPRGVDADRSTFSAAAESRSRPLNLLFEIGTSVETNGPASQICRIPPRAVGFHPAASARAHTRRDQAS
jgi:hypothetical protein